MVTGILDWETLGEGLITVEEFCSDASPEIGDFEEITEFESREEPAVGILEPRLHNASLHPVCFLQGTS
ncbi:hypothetical protein L1765_10360 [Microaerobacter geothermalis]|nr:hypothetical protein [Microaerobacter geothermalis]